MYDNADQIFRFVVHMSTVQRLEKLTKKRSCRLSITRSLEYEIYTIESQTDLKADRSWKDLHQNASEKSNRIWKTAFLTKKRPSRSEDLW